MRQDVPARRGRRTGLASCPTVAESLEKRRLLSVYFVSNSGSDTNAGTLVRPFATIQQAASIAEPGDTVFVRGGTYHETVTPSHSGTASAPIVFEPYNGESVTLTGADPVGGWAGYRGPIFQAAQPWDLGGGNNQVFVDGVMVNEARWPNAGGDLFHPATVTADTIASSVSPAGPFGGVATATITSSSLTQAAGALDGATIHIAPGEGWVWQTGTVIDSQPGQLTYQYTQLNTSYQIPRDGNRFYLTGQLQMLDSPGEWFHDSASGTLYLWTPQGDSPGAHDVEAKHRLFAFDLSGLSYITVRGFNLFAATIDTSASSHDITLSNLDARYVSQATIDPNPFATKLVPPTTGILLAGTNISLRDSTIAFSTGNGVALAGSGDTVQNCFIHDIDYAGGDEAAILIRGDNNQVLYNTIWNTGRNGITNYFSAGDRILNNVVHDFGLLTSDAGGIYTWKTAGAGTEIAYNDVFSGHAGGFGNTAIFLDNGGDNFLVHHNVAWNVDSALKLSAPAYDDQVYNNTLVGTTFSLGSNYPPDMTGSVVENNVLDGPIYWGPGVMQQHNLTGGDPGFANPAAGDYQLAAGSSAIDAGMVIPPYTDGYAGSAPDIGAYEFGRAPFSGGATVVNTPVFTAQGSPLPAQTTPPASAPRSAFATIPAASFDAMSAIQVESGGAVSAGMGGWLRFSNLDFGAGAKLLQMNLAVTGRARGLRIQVRLDSIAGPVLATLTPHGGAFHLQSARTRAAAGLHTLYALVIGRSGRLEVDWLMFVPAPQRAVRHHSAG